MNRVHGAFINARYSTDNQNPDSIEVQVQKCTEWCNQNSIPILGVFADEAVSGMKESRPQYEMMMNQLRMGLADTVVIYDQSRMFRKMTSWFSFRDELSFMGVSVVSVTQPMIGKDLRDPTNFVTEGSMALFNQMHSLITRQKVMEKMRHMARSGQHTGGKPALGYVVKDGKLIIHEEEAKVVQRIFREYAGGKSYKEIIDGLNRDGLKTKRGNSFGTNSLHDLLHNEKYIGTLVYGQSPYREDGTRNTHSKDGNAIRIEDALPAIIDKDIFYAVQQRMSQNKRQQGGRPPKNREYPLKGKVFCADCKSAMTITTSRGNYYYYRCTGKKRLHTCEGTAIRADVLEDRVSEALKIALGTPENIDGLILVLRDEAEKLQAGSYGKLHALVQREKEVSKKLENAIDAVLNGLVSPTIKSKISELENEKSLIEHEIKLLKKSVDASRIPEETLKTMIRDTIESNDLSALFSIVYRVEVSEDSITIWTLLDSDPNGDILLDDSGVIITPGVPFGVPRVFVTIGFIRIVVARKNHPPN